RALSADPRDRWPSCAEFVQALELASPDESRVRPASAALLSELMDPAAVESLLRELASRTMGPAGEPRTVLRKRFMSRLPLNVVRLKLELLCREWQGRRVRGD